MGLVSRLAFVDAECMWISGGELSNDSWETVSDASSARLSPEPILVR
jgi:hypothetical protein